jgi:hypothetical protein
VPGQKDGHPLMVMLQPGEGAGEVREHVVAGATAKWARHGHVATGGRTVRQPPISLVSCVGKGQHQHVGVLSELSTFPYQLKLLG